MSESKQVKLFDRVYNQLIRINYDDSHSATAVLNCPFAVYKIMAKCYPANETATDEKDGSPRFVYSDLVNDNIIAVTPSVDTITTVPYVSKVTYTFQESKQVQGTYRFDIRESDGYVGPVTCTCNILVTCIGAPFTVEAK